MMCKDFRPQFFSVIGAGDVEVKKWLSGYHYPDGMYLLKVNNWNTKQCVEFVQS